MQHSPNEIKDKLVQALDEQNNVVDMAAVIEVVAILEKMPITKDELERTRLGKYVNELRKKTANESLAKRAKDLVRKWRKLIVPHDTAAGTILNGERPAPTHLPGPGPGSVSVWGSLASAAGKPASPAAVASSLGNGRPLFRGKSSSPGASFHPHGLLHQQQQHRVASPGFLQCSSASTSPALVRVNNHSRPATPNARPRVGQYSSPTGEPVDRRQVHGFQPVSPAGNSLAGRTGATRHARSPKLPAGVARDSAVAKARVGNEISRPTCSSTPVSPQDVPRQHHHQADNHAVLTKRARPSSLFEDSNSCCSPPFPPTPALRAAAPAPPNGVDTGGDSLDSVPSPIAESVSLVPAKKRHNQQQRHHPHPHPHHHHQHQQQQQSEHCDVLKEKIASHLRTPKVKTTAELIEELKARNSSTASMLEEGAAAVAATAREPSPSPCPANRTAASSRSKKAASRPVLPGGDEDMARTKTELMEKFLTDTRHRAPPLPPGPGEGKDPVDEILKSLPPVSAEDAARWRQELEEEEEGGGGGGEEEEMVERPVTDEVVQRLHESQWEGVNGHYDIAGEFQSWNALVDKETLNGEKLRILPYVDID